MDDCLKRGRQIEDEDWTAALYVAPMAVDWSGPKSTGICCSCHCHSHSRFHLSNVAPHPLLALFVSQEADSLSVGDESPA